MNKFGITGAFISSLLEFCWLPLSQTRRSSFTFFCNFAFIPSVGRNIKLMYSWRRRPESICLLIVTTFIYRLTILTLPAIPTASSAVVSENAFINWFHPFHGTKHRIDANPSKKTPGEARRHIQAALGRRGGRGGDHPDVPYNFDHHWRNRQWKRFQQSLLCPSAVSVKVKHTFAPT